MSDDKTREQVREENEASKRFERLLEEMAESNETLERIADTLLDVQEERWSLFYAAVIQGSLANPDQGTIDYAKGAECADKMLAEWRKRLDP